MILSHFVFNTFLSPSLAMDRLLIKTSGPLFSINNQYFLELGVDFREPKTMEIGWTPRA